MPKCIPPNSRLFEPAKFTRCHSEQELKATLHWRCKIQTLWKSHPHGDAAPPSPTDVLALLPRAFNPSSGPVWPDIIGDGVLKQYAPNPRDGQVLCPGAALTIPAESHLIPTTDGMDIVNVAGSQETSPDGSYMVVRTVFLAKKEKSRIYRKVYRT